MSTEDKPLVTVICMAYNHENYIRDALESFVMQETNFPFEVIVHDDASSDTTAKIIREYEEKYPFIVKPIYQTENQYSKGVKISQTFIYPKAQGKYFALCEGDDYWISTQKLQKQVDYLEAHPECAWCIHNALIVGTDQKPISTIAPTRHDRIISAEEVIKGCGGFCATNSIVARREFFLNQPPFFDIYNLDLVLQMYLSICGTTFCFSEPMSAYRKGVENSWSDRSSRNKKMQVEHLEKTILVRKAFDRYTDYKYHRIIEEIVNNTRVNICEKTNDYSSISLATYVKVLLKERPKDQLYSIIRRFFQR